MLRTWAHDHDDSNASTIDLIDLAEDVSGQQLELLFQALARRSAEAHPLVINPKEPA